MLRRSFFRDPYTVLITLALLGCSSGPSTGAAEAALRKQIDNGEEGRLRLTDFKRTDGREGELAGVRLYTVMFEAKAEFVNDAMFSFGSPLMNGGSEILVGEYRAPSRGFSWSDFGSASRGFRPARKGDVLQLKGEVSFEKRESGWVASETEMTFEHDSTSRSGSVTQAAKPQPSRAARQSGDRGGSSELCAAGDADCTGYLAAMKSDLRNLVSAQESFFADSAKYTTSRRRLGFRSSAGARSPRIELSADGRGWYARISHSSVPGVLCAIAVNMPNPVLPRAGEGEAVCGKAAPDAPDESTATPASNRDQRLDETPCANGDMARIRETKPGATTFLAAEDTYVGSQYGRSGGATSSGLSYGGWGDEYVVFVRFQLDGVRTFSRAYMCLFTDKAPPIDPDITVQLVTSGWDAAAVTFDAQPSAIDAVRFGRVSSGWNAVDITEVAKAWASGAKPNHGLRLRSNAHNQTNGSFTSVEGARKPFLLVY